MSTNSMPEVGTTIGDVGGRSVVLAYGSVAAEYEALHSRAAVFDRSHRGRLRVKGERAARDGDRPGDERRLRAFAGPGLLRRGAHRQGKDRRRCARLRGGGWRARGRASSRSGGMGGDGEEVREPAHRAAQDESATLRDIGIFGANARHVVSELTGVQAPALTALAPYSHVTVEIDGASPCW